MSLLNPKSLATLLIVVGGIALTTPASAFSFNVFADTVGSTNAKADWINALGSRTFFTEDFEDTTLNPWVSFSSTEGVVGKGEGVVGQGVFKDAVSQQDSLLKETTFTFELPSGPKGAFAFGGNFSLTPLDLGSGIHIFAIKDDVETFIGEIPPTFDASGVKPFLPPTLDDKGGFWGFVATESFDAVRLAGGDNLEGQEHYYLDDLVFAPVSEPTSTLSLLALGLGVVATKRKLTSDANR